MPRGGVLAHFYRPGGQGLEISFCPGGGESKKLPRGMVKLGTD